MCRLHTYLRPAGTDAFFTGAVQPGAFAVDTQNGCTILITLFCHLCHRTDGIRVAHRREDVHGALTCQPLQITFHGCDLLFMGGILIHDIITAGAVVMSIKNAGDDPLVAVFDGFGVGRIFCKGSDLAAFTVSTPALGPSGV